MEAKLPNHELKAVQTGVSAVKDRQHDVYGQVLGLKASMYLPLSSMSILQVQLCRGCNEYGSRDSGSAEKATQAKRQRVTASWHKGRWAAAAECYAGLSIASLANLPPMQKSAFQ
eukprot:2180434-Amphidinium_carterae.1